MWEDLYHIKLECVVFQNAVRNYRVFFFISSLMIFMESFEEPVDYSW